MRIFTIGHSVHSKERLLEMLKYAEIQFVADVRAFPASRKHPQFKKENMEEWLDEAGIAYRHFPLLGGRRNQSRLVGDELNAGWRNRSFHNYADYTLTDEFKEGLDELKREAEERNVAYLCSERHPARCHRMIISNKLKADGWDVEHIIEDSEDETELMEHELGRWGAMPIIEETGAVVYPKL
ncbi:DUF488 family protein [Salinicoccus halodurans]|uniref:DNA repair protein n=1 Tax=Salinicoccus halodurans TaxID=407035 RepID=A0A0F7HKI7_9STAP|nr:DUF488 domain-containing protein [Salinicoccus halodurans]AKG73251.1 DNA repair protein [Salinicoccus halodurans]SFK83346.1 Protein of unknown function, DUF488 [Salinicoccus halodurans]